ncbi:hypothetical protein [Brevibacterium aurantiacum]|uniref:hypothetical protein n=1 Tax=Brevibacterium aurantiacum TaxID=273384 RepID=UPI001D0030F7|nr:hypothetical protein [Brevibacterium aurantiacum]
MSHKLANPAGTGSGVGEGAGRRFGAAGLGSGVGSDRAFFLLRTVFTVAPILFGLDKFFGLLTNWDSYLAPWIDAILPGTAHQAMFAVGIIEIVAGIVVAVAPKFGSLLVVAWLAGIIVNLLSMGEFFDIALRDFGLLVAALALAALAFDRPRKVKAA